MRLEQLHYLIELDKYGSISLASRQIHVTQQNISTAIQQLEKELSLILLKRTSKGVQLTADGRIILDKAKKIFVQINEIEAFSSICNQAHPNQQDALQGTIALWISPYFSKTLLPQVLNQYLQLYPKVHFDIQISASLDILEQLSLGRLNQALAFININDAYYLDHLANKSHLSSQILNDDFLTILVNKNSPFINHKSISIKKTLNQKLLFYRDSTPQNDWLMDYFLSYNPSLTTFTTNSPELCLSTLKENDIIAVMASQAAKVFADYDEIHLIPIRPKIIVDNILVTSNEHIFSLAEQLFIEMIYEINASSLQ